MGRIVIIMSKESTLIKNTAIIGIGNLSTKILTFFLLPLYTTVLATDDYGIIDVLMTVSSLVIPFVSLEMSSGVFRFIINKHKSEDIEEVISTGFFAEVFGLVGMLIFLGFVNCFYKIPHIFVFVFYIISMSLMKFIGDTLRGLGNNVLYSTSNFLVTLISLLLNLILILFLEMKGEAILLAASIGNICGIIITIVCEKLWKYISFKKVKQNVFHDLLKYTLPLIPNTVSWWVVSASDRLLILIFLGASANGIYASANKIPGIYTTIFTVYSLAWTEAVARNNEDHSFISSVFYKSINIMIFMLMGIITCSSLFFEVLIGKDYIDSYWHILILLIAIFFSSCASLLGGIFAGKMESKSVMHTTIVGAIVNLAFNIVAIKFIGLYASSLSTAIAYFIVFLIRYIQCKKWYSLQLFKRKDMPVIILLLGVIAGYFIKIKILNTILVIIIICVFFILNKESVIVLLNNLKMKVKKNG